MPQYEVIYEDGSHSVANYDSDEEALSACQAHHDRATRGEPALASAPEVRVPAVRIVKVLQYDTPPGDLLQDQTLSADVAKSEVDAALKASTKGSITNVLELAARIRDLSNPIVDSGPHETNYKAKETKELSLPWQS